MKKYSITYITVILFLVFNGCSSPPSGTQGAEADELTQKVLAATNQLSWDQVKIVKWIFDDNHYHVWDRNRNLIRVKWDDIEVFENLDNGTGKVFIGGEEQQGKEKDKYLEKAKNYWGNDSYWLNPFWKFFEGGVERRLVKRKDGSEALLITHTSGGKTPGDSFLWLLDDNGLPYAWKLWVKIIPIKGFQIGWTDWVTLPNGLKISTTHKSKFNEISIKDVEVGESIEQLFPDGDPFDKLIN